MLQGLVIGDAARSTALAILDSSSGFDLAALYALAGLQTSPDTAFAQHLFALLCKGQQPKTLSLLLSMCTGTWLLHSMCCRG